MDRRVMRRTAAVLALMTLMICGYVIPACLLEKTGHVLWTVVVLLVGTAIAVPITVKGLMDWVL